MKLKDMTYEEIELLSYTDLTYLLLKENKQPMNTPTIFRKICDLLKYDEEYYVEAIGDYYTSLTIDKRFVLLENNEWDIRDHHSIAITLDEEDDDDDFISDDDEDEEEVIAETTEEFDDSLEDEDEIDEDEDEIGLEGLTVLPEDELED
ncbi:MAG TPA: DNA-directed RNA polymerase subunit delta [Mollicutes bacterium]|nr:DNA-directed RNA polymerase subunit delta [Mollicutes bacterium]